MLFYRMNENKMYFPATKIKILNFTYVRKNLDLFSLKSIKLRHQFVSVNSLETN